MALLVSCENQLSDEALFRSVVVVSGGEPAIACTLTNGAGLRALTCDDPPLTLSDIIRSVVLDDGTVNFCY